MLRAAGMSVRAGTLVPQGPVPSGRTRAAGTPSPPLRPAVPGSRSPPAGCPWRAAGGRVGRLRVPSRPGLHVPLVRAAVGRRGSRRQHDDLVLGRPLPSFGLRRAEPDALVAAARRPGCARGSRSRTRPAAARPPRPSRRRPRGRAGRTGREGAGRVHRPRTAPCSRHAAVHGCSHFRMRSARPAASGPPRIGSRHRAAGGPRPTGRQGAASVPPALAGRALGPAGGGGGGGAQGHFTEPPVMPAAMYFCARTSRTAAGAADSTDAAITEPQSPTCAPMYW